MPTKNNNPLIGRLKSALKASRRAFGRHDIAEAKKLAADARRQAETAGLVYEAKVFEAQSLVCDHKWDDVVSTLTAVVTHDFPMRGHALDRLGIAYASKKDWGAPDRMDTRIVECSMKPEVTIEYREEAAEGLHA